MLAPNQLEELSKLLNVAQLPAMPHSALSVLQLDNDLAKVDIADLVRPIEADPGLASQVLKFLNSSYFGFQNTVSNVRQGISLVGIRVVKNFVLWKAVFSLIPKSKNSLFDVAQLWQDSLRRAMFARFVVMELRTGDPEEAFAGALLQDMAIPVMMKVKPQDYTEFFVEMKKHESLRLSGIEKKAFGWTHADAAGVLGRKWKLPESLCSLMESHIQLEGDAQKAEATAIAISALLPMAFREAGPEKEQLLVAIAKYFPGQNQLLPTVFAKLDKEYNQYASILQLATPKRSLMSYLE